MKSENVKHYENELRTLLSNPVTRIFVWRLIVEDCKVFEETFPMNASAYVLLAKQEIGKRLLNDLKQTDPESVYKAEQEYNELMKQKGEIPNE